MRCAAFPGVLAVLTADDVPGVNDCSASHGGDPILADGEILFHGQVVFAVVAEIATTRAARRDWPRSRSRQRSRRSRSTTRLSMGTKDVLPPYEFKRRDVDAALEKSTQSDRGELPGRRPGAFLSRRTGQPCPPRRAWRHDCLFLDAASNRSAAHHRQDARCARMPRSCANAGGWAAASAARKARRRNGPRSRRWRRARPDALPNAGSTATKT